VTLVCWYGGERRSAGPADGSSFSGKPAAPVSSAPQRIRIGTFNIHGGKGVDGQLDLRRTAECLRGAQLLGLNEVHGPSFGESADQAEQLGRRLGQSWLFAPAELRWFREDFGNGLLTSLQVDFWQRIPLARRTGKGYRNVVLAGLDFGARRLNVMVTHLDRASDGDRIAQLRIVTNLFLSLAEPAVLLGDLNTRPDDPNIQPLLKATGVDDPLAALSDGPGPGRIDWIVTRGLRTVGRGVDTSGASDHPYYWIDVE
jgi:endonuclease/exonuclease/phosphatase family metal-dependent hydrolase